MSADPTEGLIRELSADVTPVRRVWPLWLSFGVWALGSAIVGLVFLQGAGFAEDWTSLALGEGPYGPVAAGLAVAGLAGGAAALAERIPGRSRMVAVCGIAAVLGFGWAVGSALAAGFSHGFESTVPIAADRMCLEKALLLSVVPTTLVIGLLVRGWVAQPGRAAALALVGGAAIGSLVMHLSCGLASARHMLIGHTGAPWVLLVLVSVPLALWIRRAAR